jgi:hypothetical protein
LRIGAGVVRAHLRRRMERNGQTSPAEAE